MTLMLVLASMADARIPEPDNIVYGELPPGIDQVKLMLDADTVASYTRGDNPNAGDHFILRVPMDSVDPRQIGTARPGDSCQVLLNQDLEAVMTLEIGEKGLVQQISLFDVVDTDGDLVPDSSDNCPGDFNDDQSDLDGDGVGDVCDNCEAVANADQDDFDSDNTGDACDDGDSDGDQMPDDYEYRLGLQVGVNDAGGDVDGDTVTNLAEYQAGTNPVPMCGDVSDDTYVELDDLIETLQVASGANIAPNIHGDCTDDMEIGMPEALAIIQKVADVRD